MEIIAFVLSIVYALAKTFSEGDKKDAKKRVKTQASCYECGRSFSCSPQRIKAARHVFCCRECYWKYRKAHPEEFSRQS